LDFATPESVHVPTGPARVGCNLVGCHSTDLVEEDEDTVVDHLDLPHHWVLGDIALVVELSSARLDNLQHVVADDGVVSVRVNLGAEENLHEGIAETNSHGIDEDVAGLLAVSLEANSDEGEALPQESESRVVFRIQTLMISLA